MGKLTYLQTSFPFMQNISLDDVRLLARVAQHETFLEAGRRRGMATTTVSRRIAGLEASVGAQLVNRTHTGTVLTAAGLRLVEATHALTLELEARVRAAFGTDSQITGPLKISVAEGLAPLTLKAVQSFRERYPNVNFTIDVSNRALDMSKSEADIALRTLKPSSEGLVVRSVMAIHFGVYASSQPSVKRMIASFPAFLANNHAVVLGGELRGLKESVWMRERARSVSIEVETLGALMDAVRLGIGIGIIPDEFAAGDRTLRRIGDCDGVPRKTLWLVMNQRTSKIARVRQFAQHITQQLRSSVPVADHISQAKAALVAVL